MILPESLTILAVGKFPPATLATAFKASWLNEPPATVFISFHVPSTAEAVSWTLERIPAPVEKLTFSQSLTA